MLGFYNIVSENGISVYFNSYKHVTTLRSLLYTYIVTFVGLFNVIGMKKDEQYY